MDTRVFIAACNEYKDADAAVGRVLAQFGGAAAILNGRKRVLVKPNLVLPRKPETATTSHPAVVGAVCRAFIEAGAEVSVIDSSGMPHSVPALRTLYSLCGMEQMAKETGAALSYDTNSRKVTYPEGKTLQEFTILSPVLDAELVITVGKAKTHLAAQMTGCVKNLFGCVPGLGKPALHRQFPGREEFYSTLLDLVTCINPGFAVLDGVWGMEGGGPTGGDPKFLGVVAGGYNAHAVDLAQCHLMCLRAEQIFSLKEAAKRGLIPEDPAVLTWLGDAVEPVRFKPAAAAAETRLPFLLRHMARYLLPKSTVQKIYQRLAAGPEISARCIGCGDCKQVCPAQCIAIAEGRAAIDGGKCIKCYCCHEFCPAKAIDIQK